MDGIQLYDCLCPNSCGAALPTWNFADCVDLAPEEKSEIIKVWLDKLVVNGESGELEAENLPDEVTGASAGWAEGAQELLVIGDLPAPDTNERPISGGRTKFGLKTYTLNIDVDETSDENYTAVRTLNCGQKVAFAWATRGGYIYGTAIGTVIAANPIFERGEDAYVTYNLQIRWEAQCPPPRAEDPEADGGLGGDGGSGGENGGT